MLAAVVRKPGALFIEGPGTWIRVGTRDYSGMWWKTYWPDFQSSLSSVDVGGRGRAPAIFMSLE